MTPFFANNGMNPIFDPVTISGPSVVPDAEQRVAEISKLTAELRATISAAQERYSHFANAHRLPAPDLPIGSLVFLDRRNVKTSRPCRKFDDKNLGPLKIVERVNPVAYRLALPRNMKVHPVFHVSLLHPKSVDVFPQQVLVPPHPVKVDDHDEYVVEKIMDRRVFRGKPQFLVDWKGYPPSERTWEYEANLANCQELLKEFLARQSS
jgi:hypothetical protein